MWIISAGQDRFQYVCKADIKNVLVSKSLLKDDLLKGGIIRSGRHNDLKILIDTDVHLSMCV